MNSEINTTVILMEKSMWSVSLNEMTPISQKGLKS